MVTYFNSLMLLYFSDTGQNALWYALSISEISIQYGNTTDNVPIYKGVKTE